MIATAAFEMLVIVIADAFLRDDLQGIIALEHNKVDRNWVESYYSYHGKESVFPKVVFYDSTSRGQFQ